MSQTTDSISPFTACSQPSEATDDMSGGGMQPPLPRTLSTQPSFAYRPTVSYDEVTGIKKYEEDVQAPAEVVHTQGIALLYDPWYNKGTGFPLCERERLGLRGLLPPRVSTMQRQEERFMADFEAGVTMVPAEEIEHGGVTSDMARKWMALQNLQDRNETLFYGALMHHFEAMAPIVYTPTVGWVCTNYHKLYRRARGMYFSAADRGEMAAMAYNWPQADVHAIVVTDGSRILGLGDLGCNGLGIPIGKLDLYVAAAGFSPQHVLPVMLDVGTNNEALRNDKMYVGLQQQRLEGDEYVEVVDEFVHAVTSRWPNAVLQFEDFSTDHALVLLERYRNHHLVFNDDIQGTAATALAGLYGALRAAGKPMTELAAQRIVVMGKGSAAMGVINMICRGMAKQGGMSREAAARNFWILDSKGLITRARGSKAIPEEVLLFARPLDETGEEGREGDGLLQVVKAVKPTVLLGLAGAGRLFTPEVLAAVGATCDRPIIMPMSNPTSKLECTSQEAFEATQGRCIFASGSPQPPVSYEGKVFEVTQANNMYIFPGLALGAFLGQTGVVLDEMLEVAAGTLPLLISDADLAKGRVYPRLSSIRAISARIAAEVIREAARLGLEVDPGAAVELSKGGLEGLMAWVRKRMYQPVYKSLAYLPPGFKA